MRSVPPREFIDAQLAYLNGKLNELKLPKSARRSAVRLVDTEEKCKKRRRPVRYANHLTAAKVLAACDRRHRRAVKVSIGGDQQSSSVVTNFTKSTVTVAATAAPSGISCTPTLPMTTAVASTKS